VFLDVLLAAVEPALKGLRHLLSMFLICLGGALPLTGFAVFDFNYWTLLLCVPAALSFIAGLALGPPRTMEGEESKTFADRLAERRTGKKFLGVEQ
jgi:hypothetical protein